MKLALALGHFTSVEDARRRVQQACQAEQLGYASVWASEAYGSDAVTLLSHIQALTTTLEIGSAVMQIPARTPAMTAMTAASMDLLSGGRFRLGLGVSGGQVSEGWHGVPFVAPMARTREYVSIVRQALRREVVRSEGQHYPLPPVGSSSKALKLSLHPLRSNIPIYLAAVGPDSVSLTGKIADGWLASLLSVDTAAAAVARLAAARAFTGQTMESFDVLLNTPVVIGDDVAACADQVRDHVALYIGGMGSREQNFYNRAAIEMGFESAAREVQDLYLSGDRAGAAAAIPVDLIDDMSLLGPLERISERLQAFAAVGITTIAVGSTGGRELGPETLRNVAKAFEHAGVG
jgi:F420-dependent oxidoreductase-like protein